MQVEKTGQASRWMLQYSNPETSNCTWDGHHTLTHETCLYLSGIIDTNIYIYIVHYINIVLSRWMWYVIARLGISLESCRGLDLVAVSPLTANVCITCHGTFSLSAIACMCHKQLLWTMWIAIIVMSLVALSLEDWFCKSGKGVTGGGWLIHPKGKKRERLRC